MFKNNYFLTFIGKRSVRVSLSFFAAYFPRYDTPTLQVLDALQHRAGAAAADGDDDDDDVDVERERSIAISLTAVTWLSRRRVPVERGVAKATYDHPGNRRDSATAARNLSHAR